MTQKSGGGLTLLDLLGRRVEDANGRRVGRVWDVEATREDDALCVVALVVGASDMWGRFGWSRSGQGRRVPWEEVDRLEPRIKLRGSGDPWR
jgi:sporulation protein YlmC with PRC-barrel domain